MGVAIAQTTLPPPPYAVSATASSEGNTRLRAGAPVYDRYGGGVVHAPVAQANAPYPPDPLTPARVWPGAGSRQRRPNLPKSPLRGHGKRLRRAPPTSLLRLAPGCSIRLWLWPKPPRRLPFLRPRPIPRRYTPPPQLRPPRHLYIMVQHHQPPPLAPSQRPSRPPCRVRRRAPQAQRRAMAPGSTRCTATMAWRPIPYRWRRSSLAPLQI